MILNLPQSLDIHKIESTEKKGIKAISGGCISGTALARKPASEMFKTNCRAALSALDQTPRIWRKNPEKEREDGQ